MSSRRKESTPVRDNEDKIRMFASVSFMVVIVVIGVPMWWKTTEVYRVPLPYSEIESLSDDPIATESTVHVYTNDPSRTALLVSELENAFNSNKKLTIYFRAAKISNAVMPHSPTKLESLLMDTVTLRMGDFMFIEWRNLTEDVLVTSGRTAFISGSTSAKKCEQVLRTWIFQEHKLNMISPIKRTFEELKRGRATGEATQPSTDVIVTVINPNAELQTVHWDVRSATKRYIQPFLDELSMLSKFHLKTQWKYQVTIGQQLNQVQDDSVLGRHYALPEDYLTHFVTTLERNIGQGITMHPAIQLIVYVPPCKSAPMKIYSKSSKPVDSKTERTNSFISPKWGGVIIYNPEEDLCQRVLNGSYLEEKPIVNVNTHEVMTVVLHLIRSLLDVDMDIPIPGANIEALTQLKGRDWERDAYIRAGVVNLMNSVTITLQSLIQLLNDINYIVINDEVGNAIHEANRNIRVAKELFQRNDLLDALKYAKEAFKYAEMAFFDPSLLALLYFPDEQKYAIYIPLFLPIMIPVLFSFSALLKSFKSPGNTDDKPKID